MSDCSKALELNPRYVKALFRRAKAYEMMNQKMQCLEGKQIRFKIRKEQQIAHL